MTRSEMFIVVTFCMLVGQAHMFAIYYFLGVNYAVGTIIGAVAVCAGAILIRIRNG